jgi:hypothetical protein
MHIYRVGNNEVGGKVVDTKQGDRELVPVKVKPREKQMGQSKPVEELPKGWWRDLQNKNRKWGNL